MVDLLGMLAYATLSGFFRLSDEAAIATSLPDKIALAEIAVAEYGHFRQLLRRLEELDADPDAAMQPFVQALDAFHARTRPADWLEGLVKAYVGDGISADFYTRLRTSPIRRHRPSLTRYWRTKVTPIWWWPGYARRSWRILP